MRAVPPNVLARAELPIWADEGMAVLADPAAKQQLHLRDLQRARRQHSERRLAELPADGNVPTCADAPPFYGQSLSLVKFLVDRKTPAEFVRFLHAAGELGYDAALRECYGLAGIAELERQWGQATAGPLAVRLNCGSDSAAARVGRVASSK